VPPSVAGAGPGGPMIPASLAFAQAPETRPQVSNDRHVVPVGSGRYFTLHWLRNAARVAGGRAGVARTQSFGCK